MIEEKTERRPQRKRIPVVAKYLAGSPLGIRGTLKRPQVPPAANKPKPEPRIELPRCPHGILLARAEFEFQRPFLADGRLLESSVCTACYPYCIHVKRLDEAPRRKFKKVDVNPCKLTPAEIGSGKRYSARCIECNPGGKHDPKVYNRWLLEHGLGVGRGMAPADFIFNNSDGTAIIVGSQGNFCTGGGSNEMERTDATSIGRSDVPAQGSNWQESSGDTYSDEQVRVDDLGDPVSPVASDFVTDAEQIRSESTTEMIGAKPEHKSENVASGLDELQEECDEHSENTEGNHDGVERTS